MHRKTQPGSSKRQGETQASTWDAGLAAHLAAPHGWLAGKRCGRNQTLLERAALSYPVPHKNKSCSVAHLTRRCCQALRG